LVAEQKEITRRVEEIFAIANDLQSGYETAASRVEKLTSSVLAKAFRGELVPQEPNDEPANELLARIRKLKENSAMGRKLKSRSWVPRIA
jgi:type I restriction enzyme S subunit